MRGFSRAVLDDALARILGLAFLTSGLVGCWAASTSGLRHVSTWSWDPLTCEVIDVRVSEKEPFLDQIYTSGTYEVLFDLAVAGTGQTFTDMPAAPSRPTYHEQYDLQQEILPATPGSRVDCWVAPDGSAAYIRLAPRWFVMFHIGGALFALVLVGGGGLLLFSSSAQHLSPGESPERS